MTHPINERPFAAPDRLPPVRSLPVEATTPAEPEPLPKLKIWASYPDGSTPETVEVVYDVPGDVPVSFVAGIIRALERPAGRPEYRVDVVGAPPSTKAIQTAVNRAAAERPFNAPA